MRRRDESGLAALAAVTLAGVLVVVTAGVSVLGGLLVDRRRATVAADLASLAAAGAVQHGQSNEGACSAARRLAALNQASVLRCSVRGEAVDVTVELTHDLGGPGPLGRTVTLRVTARAGPVDLAR